MNEALEQSIEHWRQLSTATSIGDVSIGATNCALCQLFNNETTPFKEGCVGCPVWRRTGLRRCEGTPYQRTRRILEVWREIPDSETIAEVFRGCAREELAFLESLRGT